MQHSDEFDDRVIEMKTPLRYRIRALNGPLRDAVFDPSVRLTIGRGCDCDIQIVHNGVSRQHAAITVDEQGRHVLSDLESTNGVYVEQKRVDRFPLTVGTVFEVMRYCFVYEVDEAASGTDEDAAVPRLAGPPASRTTISYVAFTGSTKPPQNKVAEAPSTTMSSPRVKRYDGDIVGDIADYRSLRTRLLRGESQTPQMRAVFRRLEHRMRCVDGSVPGSSTRWSYRRFPCRITGTVRLFTGDELPVQLVDVGVDGAKLAIGSHSITPDTLVWLAVERMRDGVSRMLVFPGRAVWVRSRHLGVSFSGAPGWSLRGSSPEAVERTMREVPRYEGPDQTAVINLAPDAEFAVAP